MGELRWASSVSHVNWRQNMWPTLYSSYFYWHYIDANPNHGLETMEAAFQIRTDQQSTSPSTGSRIQLYEAQDDGSSIDIVRVSLSASPRPLRTFPNASLIRILVPTPQNYEVTHLRILPKRVAIPRRHDQRSNRCDHGRRGHFAPR